MAHAKSTAKNSRWPIDINITHPLCKNTAYWGGGRGGLSIFQQQLKSTLRLGLLACLTICMKMMGNTGDRVKNEWCQLVLGRGLREERQTRKNVKCTERLHGQVSGWEEASIQWPGPFPTTTRPCSPLQQSTCLHFHSLPFCFSSSNGTHSCTNSSKVIMPYSGCWTRLKRQETGRQTRKERKEQTVDWRAAKKIKRGGGGALTLTHTHMHLLSFP